MTRCLRLLALCVLFLPGCVTTKQPIPPYQGRAEREAALRKQEVRPRPQPKAPPQDMAAPQVESPQPLASHPRTMQEDILLPVLTQINERIFAYERKQQRLEALSAKISALGLDEEKLARVDQCLAKVQEILDGYNELHQRLLPVERLTAEQVFGGEELLRLNKRDMGFLEGECTLLLATGTGEPGRITVDRELIEQKKEELVQASARGDHGATIQAYQQLLELGVTEPPYDLTYAYGLALMKSAQEKKAKQVLVDLLRRIRRQDQAQWEFRLMKLIGDLEFALQEYQAARDQYEEMARIYGELNEQNEWAQQQLSALNVADEKDEEVRDYAEVLRSFLAYVPERDGFTVLQKAEAFVARYPYSLVASSADRLVTLSRERAEKWYRELVGRIDELVKAEQYQEALLAIERVPRRILPIEKQQELAARADEIRTQEALKRKAEELAREQEMLENWNQGMTSLQAREYDQAIDAFKRLMGTEYEDRARKRIDEAANLAAREDRRRAAELFVRSGRTHDLESRKKLLMASRQLLQDILVKYPQADLIDKVRRNLARIEDEIRAIDPALLDQVQTVGGQVREPAAEGSAPATGEQPESLTGTGESETGPTMPRDMMQQ